MMPDDVPRFDDWVKTQDPNRIALANPRVRDFLDRIGQSEGADYNTLVGGARVNDLSRHPNRVGLVTSAGPSTAFGKYQIVGSTERSKLRRYSDLDYSPENQDVRAVELLRQTGALEALERGDTQTAIQRAGREWASLPGSPLPGRKNPRAFQDTQPTPQIPKFDDWVKSQPSEQVSPPTVSATATPAKATPAPIRPLEAGNINLRNRPRVRNPDGFISTVRSISVNIDGREVLLPTISDDGRNLTEQQAIEQYRRTGRHLGIFATPAEATAYAQQLHEQQARQLQSRRHPRSSQIESIADLRRLDDTVPISLADLRQAEDRALSEAARPIWGLIPKDVDPRVLKGEQPTDRLAAMRRSDVQTRLEPRRTEVIAHRPTAIQGRRPGLLERAGEVVSEYAPGIASLDTPAGPKTDIIRGAVSAATLGALDLHRPVTHEEELLHPQAQTEQAVAEEIGSTAGFLVPLTGTARLVNRIASLQVPTRAAAAARVGLTFGGVEAARQAIQAGKTGEFHPDEILVSTAIGAVMGAIPAARNPTIKQRLVAAILPQALADYQRGTPLEQAVLNAGLNLGFEATGIAREIDTRREGRGLQSEIQPPVEAQRAEVRQEGTPTGRAANPTVRGEPETVSPSDTGSGLRSDAISRVRPADSVAEQAGQGNVVADAPQRYSHVQFGNIVRAEDQIGARKGRVKVYEEGDPSKIHYVRNVDLRGRGNERMVPLRAEPTAQDVPAEQPALPTAEPAIEVVPPASETASPPAESVTTPVTEVSRPRPAAGTEITPEQVLRTNHDLLLTPEFRQHVLGESVGGNAGEGRAVVNAAIDKEGRVVQFGNRLDLSEDVRAKRDRGEYRNAAFVVKDALSDSPVVERVVLEQPILPGKPREIQSKWSIDFETGETQGVIPPEFQELVPQRPRPTAPKDAAMQADRTELGLPELEQLPRVRAQEVLTEAQQRNSTNSRATDTLLDQALKGGKNFTNVETMQVNLRAQEVKNRLNAINTEAYKETDPARLADLRAESDTLLAEFDRISTAQDKAGAEWSRAGTARQRAIAEDYSLVGLVARAKKAKGRDLTTEERTRYEQQSGRITELESQLDLARSRVDDKRFQREIDKLARSRRRGDTRQSLDAEYAQLLTDFRQARAEVPRVQASGLAGLDPEGKLTRIVLRMARNRVLAGVNSATQLVDDIYADVRELLPGATQRDIRDAISGYSLIPKTQRTDLQDRLNSLRAELRTISREEDIAAGSRTRSREGPQLPSQGPPRRVFTRNEQRAKQITEQISDLERRIDEQDFTPRPKQQRLPYTKEVQRLEEQLQHQKNRFELEMERASPGHWLRQLSGIRKSWMLSGLSTQAKNIGGTGAYQVFDEIARLPAVIADAAIAPFTNRRTITANPVAMLDSVIHTATVGRREAGQILRRGATQEQLERHQFSEIDTGVKVIDLTSNLVFRFMSASDRIFYNYAYARNLHDRARAQAINEGTDSKRARTKELVENPPEELDAAAKHDALVSTFNNNNQLSNAIKRARAQMGSPANFAIDLVMPFDRTPTNVIARIIEASPVGGTVAATRLARGLINKSLTAEQQRQFSQTLGRATVGTALMGLGWTLADDLLDVEKYQVFINIGNQRYDLASISPVGNILALGARLRKDYDKGSATGAVKTVAGVPLQQPLLKSTTEVVESFSDPERSLTRTGARLASSFIPMGGLVRDVGKLIDPEERRAVTFKEQVQQNIPIARQRLPVKPRRRRRLQISSGRPRVGARP